MEDIKKILALRKYVDKERPPVEVLIKIRGKTILTPNNFITISGLPKARKTSFMNLFLAAALLRKEIMNIETSFKKEDKILLIDTEQSEDDFYTQVKYLKTTLGTKKLPEQLQAYLFREDQPEDILKYIEELIIEERPRLLIIDNLTELVLNTNDIAESKKVVLFLKRITVKYNLALIGLLHINKGNGFTAGNFGSMVDRASQSVLKVELDKETDISTLSATMLRSAAHFEPISIQFNNKTNTYESAETPSKEGETAKKRKFSMEDYTKEDLKGIVSIAFEHQKEHSYSSIVTAFKGLFGRGDTIIKQIVIPYLVFKKHLYTANGIYTNS